MDRRGMVKPRPEVMHTLMSAELGAYILLKLKVVLAQEFRKLIAGLMPLVHALSHKSKRGD